MNHRRIAVQLLSDIRARKLDTVVVYKVDRLTRSLSEDHLRRLLREYIEYYNTERVHMNDENAQPSDC